MTQTQKLHQLLSRATKDKDFQMFATDLKVEFGDAFEKLVELGWLIEDYADLYPCDCGASHPPIFFEGKYLIGCDTDAFDGLEEIKKSDLLLYTFSPAQFIQWLNSQLGLKETVEVVNDSTWYLGQWQTQGKQRNFYFTKEVSSVPNKKDRIVLFVGDNKHKTQSEALNLLDYIEMDNSEITLDCERLKAQFSAHLPLTGLTVNISEKLILTQAKDGKQKSFIHFGEQHDGQFDNVIPIRPTAFNIVFNLDRLRKTSNPKRSAKELVQAGGISKSARSVTTRISDLNKILTDRNWQKLILRDSSYKYYMNPDLYDK